MTDAKAEKSLNERVSTRAQNLLLLSKMKLSESLDDLSAVTSGDMKRVSPAGYQLLFDAVADHVSDKLDPNAPTGFSVPLEMFLDLPDKTRLRMNYDPTTKETVIRFGTRF